MADVDAAPAPEAAPAPAKKAPKKKPAAKKTKVPASHPKYSDMVKAAISNLKERGGCSRQSISKYIQSNYKVSAESVKQHLKVALRRGVTNGTLKQSKGTGASGSFKLGEKTAAAPKKPKAKSDKPKTKKVKKPKVATATKKTAKPKKAKAKKPAGEKKPKAAKAKSAKPKAAKAKSTKKAKSPAKKKAAKK